MDMTLFNKFIRLIKDTHKNILPKYINDHLYTANSYNSTNLIFKCCLQFLQRFGHSTQQPSSSVFFVQAIT